MLIILAAVRSSSVADDGFPCQDRLKATQEEEEVVLPRVGLLFSNSSNSRFQNLTTLMTFTTLTIMRLSPILLSSRAPSNTTSLSNTSSAIGPNATLNIVNKQIQPDGFQRS